MRASDFAYFDAPTPIGLAHRGGADYVPNHGRENSLAAFRTAVEMGYRYLETDVHATSDGELLAFHDTTLDRVTNGSGLVSDQVYDALRDVLISDSEPIPRLSDLLEEFPQTRINIDVKASGAIEPLARTIARHNAVQRVCVASFSEGRLRRVRQLLGPRVATAAGPVGVVASRFAPALLGRWLASPAPVLQIPPRYRIGERTLTLVTPTLVERLHRRGKHVHVWTIDDRDEMNDLLDLGVDGIVSDRIDTLRDVLAERGVPLSQ